MAFVADYSFARPSPAALRAAGYTGAMRYVSLSNPSTQGKIITPSEYTALVAAFGDPRAVTLNYEYFTTRPFDGYAAGVQDADIADAQASAVGYPLDMPIYYSVDTGATVDQVRPYFQGVHKESHRPIGVYGGFPLGLQLVREGLVTHVWCANASSWSGFNTWDSMRAAVPADVHLVQHLDHPFGFGGQVDHNEVLRDDYNIGRGLFVSLSPAQEMQVADAAVKTEQLYDIIFGHAGEPPNFLTDIHDKLVPTINAHVDAKIAEVEAKIAQLGGGSQGTLALSDGDVQRIATAVVALVHQKTA